MNLSRLVRLLPCCLFNFLQKFFPVSRRNAEVTREKKHFFARHLFAYFISVHNKKLKHARAFEFDRTNLQAMLQYKVRKKEKVHLLPFQHFLIQSALSASKPKGHITESKAQGTVVTFLPHLHLVPVTLRFFSQTQLVDYRHEWSLRLIIDMVTHS